jgi:hypothetical protein
MTQSIIFTNELGGVSVCTPTGELSIEEVKEKDTPAGSLIVNTSDLPTDNDFFDAWELANGVVTVSLAKAKELTKNRLRMERKPLLAEQDILFQRALESNLPTAAIVVEKQRLRDYTSLVDSAKTLDELKALVLTQDEVKALVG